MRPWLAIGAATGIGAAGWWTGLLFGAVAPALATSLVAVGALLAVFALAGLSGKPDPMGVAVKAGVAGLGTAAFLVLSWSVGGNQMLVALVPLALFGLPGLVALPTPREVGSPTARLVTLAAVGAALVGVGVVDVEVWALVAPLLPLPALGLSDLLSEPSHPGTP
ncbi:MAG TPA: hypothetical protein ENK55_09190 [Actinobacteria bacterium]|nr:hypothetical protein [Actinomycetota bacterium]